MSVLKTLNGNQTIAEAEATERLESDLSALDELYEMDVHYIYIGSVGDFSGAGLQPELLRQSDRIKVLYDREGVVILEISSEPA